MGFAILTHTSRCASQILHKHLRLVLRRLPTMSDLTDCDATQVKLLEEMCIVVDANDKVVGYDTKKNCHLLANIRETNLLHRAFSVFLFNTNNELLLQQRSAAKITFPGLWTNSCCSHPLYNADEMVEEPAGAGVKCAARRRLNYELGISLDDISPSDLHYLTRIHYKAESDGMWAEHEIDYVIFMKKDVDLHINENEVQEHRYVSSSELKEMIEKGTPLTPWFKMICEAELFKWWEDIDDLKKHEDTKSIQKFL